MVMTRRGESVCYMTCLCGGGGGWGAGGGGWGEGGGRMGGGFVSILSIVINSTMSRHAVLTMTKGTILYYDTFNPRKSDMHIGFNRYTYKQERGHHSLDANTALGAQ